MRRHSSINKTHRQDLNKRFRESPKAFAALELGAFQVLIKPTNAAIKETLSAAKNIINTLNKDKFQNCLLTTIIDYSSEGIFSLDENGKFTCFNIVAKKILNLAKLLRNITDTSTPPILRKLLGDSSFILHELLKDSGQTLIYNRIPIDIHGYRETIITVQKVSYYQQVEHTTRIRLAEKGFIAQHKFHDIIYSSNLMRNTIKNAMLFSKTTATILIQGDTGTGKELFAQSIHNESPVRNGPFVAINCAALPQELLESELFGYEDGAFTGARKGGKAGLFELAHNGTIFLDEIGEIPLSIQSRLLRVLQEKEIMRIGGTGITKINVRVIAATNKDLYDLMTKNIFSSDLYFRLNVLTLKIPSLKERPEDIKHLAEFFLQKYNNEYQRQVKSLSSSVLSILAGYSWPGNIRELETFMEKLVITADGGNVSASFVKATLSDYTGQRPVLTSPACPSASLCPEHFTIKLDTLENMERQIIKYLLKATNGNKQLTAAKLEISRTTIWSKLKSSQQETDFSIPYQDIY